MSFPFIHKLPPTDRWPVWLLHARWRLADARRDVPAAFYRFLDTRVFPAIQAYATHRLHIAFMVGLWAALLVCGSWTAFELTGGNYTNGLSGLLTCVILLQQQKHHTENRTLHAQSQAMHTEHARAIATLHTQLNHQMAELATRLPTGTPPEGAETPATPSSTADTPASTTATPAPRGTHRRTRKAPPSTEGTTEEATA